MNPSVMKSNLVTKEHVDDEEIISHLGEDDDNDLEEDDSGKTRDNDGNDEDDSDDSDDSVRGDKQEAKKARVSWTNPEVSKMLTICFDKHVVQKMDGILGQNLTRRQIFTSVAKALKEAKLSKQEKTWSHCFDKFKKQRKEYRKCMRKNGKSGEGRHTCKFFEELNNLFHKRPTVTCQDWGFENNNFKENDINISQCVNEVEDQLTATTVSTSSTSASASQKPPKYRSGAAKLNTASIIQQWIESDKRELEKEREWLEKLEERRAERQIAAMQTMASTFASTLSSSFESMTMALLTVQQQQQSHQNNFQQPQNLHNFNFPTPSLSPQPITSYSLSQPKNIQTPLSVIQSSSSHTPTSNSSHVPNIIRTTQSSPTPVSASPKSTRGPPKMICISASTMKSLFSERQFSSK